MSRFSEWKSEQVFPIDHFDHSILYSMLKRFCFFVCPSVVHRLHVAKVSFTFDSSVQRQTVLISIHWPLHCNVQ